MIKRYYKVDGRPYGYIEITDRNDGGFTLGWSMCNPKDTFNKKKARLIAKNRRESNKYIIHDGEDIQDLVCEYPSLLTAEQISHNLVYENRVVYQYSKGDISYTDEKRDMTFCEYIQHTINYIRKKKQDMKNKQPQSV